MSVKRMSDATLASRTVAAKRHLDSAKAELDGLTTEVKARPTFGTVDTPEGKVTLGQSSSRASVDTSAIRADIARGALFRAILDASGGVVGHERVTTEYDKRTDVAASVRVTFH